MRTALAFQSSAHLISYFLRGHALPVTLVVCSSREQFVAELQNACASEQSNAYEDFSSASSHGDFSGLVMNTIEMLSLSSDVVLLYAPTLHHLRAFLSVHRPAFSDEVFNAEAPDTTSLAFWGLIDLHRSTADYTAQGLSRTISLAVETAYLAKQRLILAEPVIARTSDDSEETLVLSPWEEQVPLLSDSVKIEGGRQTLAVHSLQVGNIIQRWCSITAPTLSVVDH